MSVRANLVLLLSLFTHRSSSVVRFGNVETDMRKHAHLLGTQTTHANDFSRPKRSVPAAVRMCVEVAPVPAPSTDGEGPALATN